MFTTQTQMNYNVQTQKTIVITTKNVTYQIEASSISHIICDGCLCNIFIENNEKITCSKLLKYFEKELSGYGFIRIHTIQLQMPNILNALIMPIKP